MKLRPVAVLLALTVAGWLLAGSALFSQEPVQAPPPEPTPTPAPSPTPTPPPPLPPGPAPSPGPSPSPSPVPGKRPVAAPPVAAPAETESIGQAYPMEYRSVSNRLADDPNNPALLNEMGNILLKGGRVRGAIAHYERALKLQPDMAMVWNNLGLAYTAAGKFASGESAYHRAIKLSPSYAMAYYNLGVNFDLRDRYDEAIAYYQRAIELDPSLLDVRVNPQVASNHHLAAILAKSYLDRGGSVVYPTQSMYPPKSRKPSKP